ncbi:MAG TPA: hypothetical protein PK344_17580 [Syntrophorhabdaceae bacterium]|jgi:ribonuclease HI|nr:hypothetical protein [Syntrophorhabdaceae bacterium]
MSGISAEAWFDGACTGNPAPIGIGGVIVYVKHEVLSFWESEGP